MEMLKQFGRPCCLDWAGSTELHPFADDRLKVELRWLDDARHSCRSLQGMTMNSLRVPSDTELWQVGNMIKCRTRRLETVHTLMVVNFDQCGVVVIAYGWNRVFRKRQHEVRTTKSRWTPRALPKHAGGRWPCVVVSNVRYSCWPERHFDLVVAINYRVGIKLGGCYR